MKTYLLAALLYLSATLTAAEKPNILFILTDDQRFDNLSCYGNEIFKTPEIDKIAARGVRFENTFITTPICAASRASIFSGLFETTHGFTFGMKALSPAIMKNSYPALLKAHGYKTGFTGKFGVRLADNKKIISQMFDTFKPAHGPFLKKMKDGRRQHTDEISGEEAMKMMEDFKDSPFCISVSFRSTHADDGNHQAGIGHFPYPEAVKNMYKDVTFPMPKFDTKEYHKTLPDFLTDPKTSMNRFRYFWRWDTKEKYQKNMQAYARMTTGIDTIVGRLQAKLKELNLDKKTIVIYTADNGFSMGKRGFAGKWNHFEESLRVPLIIHDPRLEKPTIQSRSEVTLNIDLTATMLDLAGIERPVHYQGKSLVPFLSSKTPATWRDYFFCEHRMNNPRIPKWQGIRGSKYTYANYYENNYEFLYDRQKDPEQLKNLAKSPEYKEILQDMRRDSEAHRRNYLNSPILK
jgi:arylsulfatase A-like enzyme